MYSARRLAALACLLLLLSAVACTPGSSHQDSKPTSAPSASSSNGDKNGALRLEEAIGRLKVARESRAGYERDKFHLWIDADHDGCDTRKEVLLSEAVAKPRQGKNCKLTGGKWRSYYDDKTVTDARKLDIDHVVPLAEAWDSGASKWTPERREQYANDLDADRSLVAVSLGENRTKGDKDPAEWMPPAKGATCTYATDWVAAKLRWKLTADRAEAKALRTVAAGCTDATVKYTPAP
ncbi:HNH endonuclease [Streptomyces sp. ID38640]|uniref:HNH endonuclease family protein n=1 Tax=Streptomyces sp. ID38640 TaxID=1265399 RepID=UPI00140EAC2C|nr:HNH endonuclease family protein [Streptomyces sp. ID38640]QIK04732.1 HNH endonuclease [Streptomyces sp. ID38640]QIK10897.1 HNH endonuclease [Streptomyces sp. ID38640]QIK10914.1 HNH endonuclease [Streptomyces sp. ID38640]